MANVTNGNNGKSLESWIWDAACSIRGAKDAAKYKECRVGIIWFLSFRFTLCSLFLRPFGCGVSQYSNHVRNFNTPHRTGLVDFPHPALQINSQNT